MTSSSKVPAETLGLASLARVAADPNGVKYVWDSLIVQLTDAPDDVGASLTLSTLLQLTGNRDKGLELQASAIAAQRSYKSTHGAGDGLRILAFMTAGDFMANTPLDFLLEGSDAELISVYIDGPPPPASELPDHDVAFLAIGQSETSDRLLARLEHAFDRWPTKVINNRPDRIAALTRDGVAASFAGHPTILAPATHRVARDSLGGLPDGVTFPIIIRPAGSHAGHGLEQAADAASLADYLGRHPDPEFYVSPFIDYSGSDGLFRKLRVVFIDGEAFVSHMAVSPRWMVHYLNADMETNAANRAEEAEMMATFDTGFAVRHAAAFRTLIDTFQLDYFGVDCAETADGRLLLFEADVAMIVHAMDPPELYPYKKPAMAKLFSAFMAFMAAAAVEHSPLVPA
jgi:glutathione synthase/RimK-type ligase-like ATP-grasp enzyme